MNAMDPAAVSQSTLAPANASRRRAVRENETAAQRLKREKAAERQRRKRERDRHVNNLNAAMSYAQPAEPPEPQPQPASPATQPFASPDFSPEELARRERVRAAARERQRKHRNLVKQRKMRDLGIDVPPDILPAIDDVQFRVNGQGEYPVLPHEMPHPMNPTFPQPPMTAGQNFASTVMVSLSYLDMKQQNILRSLSLTVEDLASLEPIIADAFDQWDHQRRMHFAAQAAKSADGALAGPSAPPFPDMNDPSANGFDQPPPITSEFRARFHRPLLAPSPFRTFNPAESTTATTTTPTSTPGSGPPSDPIDPNLGGAVLVPGEGRQKDHDTEGVVG